MSVTQFKVGDKVRYETQYGSDYGPRWDWTRDLGGSGMYVERKVHSTTCNLVYLDINNGILWHFPIEGHPEYDPEQWSRPGFFQKVSGEKFRLIDIGGHYETMAI